MSEPYPAIESETRARLIERYQTIDGRAMRRLTEAALQWLRTNQEIVNSLNVFPVPDGDTGTNMVLTMQAAWDEIASQGERSIGKLAKSIAHGALMGARGNSGVILSQLWRGFARTLDDHPVMDVELFVESLAEARETAYKGVVRPVEGTILTVSSDIAIAAKEAMQNGASSFLEILEIVVKAADESVQRTPDLLPVLKEAGVVDSGGLGLYFILDGMLRAVYRLPLDQALATVVPLSELKLDDAMDSIEPGQDWEVVIDFRPRGELDLKGFYEKLEKMGTSIQMGEGDGIYRMHIHVPDTKEFEPIECTRKLGTITNISIENLMIQVEDQAQHPAGAHPRLATVEAGEIAAIIVSPGPGISNVFASLGAAAIVEGGQTMNPSTREILDAIDSLPTDKIVILPNNKNIYMAACQATELTVKDAVVIPSVSIPQGVSALLALEPDKDLEYTQKAMTRALEDIQFGELTVATRSVTIDDVVVQEGQVIGLLNGRLAVSGDDLSDSLIGLLTIGKVEEAELVTLYSGVDLPMIQANQIADRVQEIWPGIEVELVEGGQPHYQIIFSIE
ncbi:MAG: DAK2 domain-containing protein [Anaerolineales bacterium]|nr:DAK2 domain-containing protein [Anaerolineales bacterium]